MEERKDTEWLVNVEWLWCDTSLHAVTWDVCTCSYVRHVYMQLHETCVHAVTWVMCICIYMRHVYMQLHETCVHAITWVMCTCSYMRRVYMQLHETCVRAVTWDMCTCSYILNHNEQSILLSIAVMYMYTKLQTHSDISIAVTDNQIHCVTLHYTMTAITPLQSTLRNTLLLTKPQLGTITSLITERKNLFWSSSE